MNRFRSRKKPRDGDESARKPSTDFDIHSLPSFASMSFKRSKKAHQKADPMPRTLDLSTALPSTHDFRTSLIMPNLSARFSMLREQDDPTSKLGKANDDSVLFPKRASRLNLFNHHDLVDIAEAASLDGSIRPPFASGGRTASYGSGDGYATDDDASRNGSMMSRPKHGEGNNLFGGRQKIYKIPVGGPASGRNHGSNWDADGKVSSTMGGKALFSDDVAMSSFQKLRLKDRQEPEQQEERRSQDGQIGEEQPTEENERSASPSIPGYNKKRETTSSTASGPSNIRNSTAATSVASQSTASLQATQPPPSVTFAKPMLSPSLDRTFTKSKRLYGQGLEQHMHDQQSSALTRLGTIQRQRANGGTAIKRLSQSRSATGLNDMFHRSGPLYASNNFRAASPVRYITPPGLGDFDMGLGSGQAVSSENTARPLSPPLSRPMSPVMGIGDENSPLATALQPNDRGKATALGAFNKPAEQYSEQQYAQRQLQLQNGRITPSKGRGSPSPIVARNSCEGSRVQKDPLISFQSRSESASRVPELCLKEPGIHSDPGISKTHAKISDSERHSDEDGTFLAGTSSSEAEEQAEQQSSRQPLDGLQGGSLARAVDERTSKHKSQSSQMSPLAQYQPSGRLYMDLSEDDVPDSLSQKTAVQPRHDLEQRSAVSQPMDSPTLGPTTGLRGLIKAHLRNDSGQSSIYPPDSPATAARFASYNFAPTFPTGDERTSSAAADTPIHDSPNTRQWNSEPLDLEGPEADDSAPPWTASRARQILEQATALRNHESEKVKQMLGDNKAQRVLGGEAPRPGPYHSASWKDQANKFRHSRGASTETQQEREDFANELAERRRRVQDNLAGFVSGETEPASPVPGKGTADNSPAKPSNAFAMLRSKSSHASLHHDKNSKALKMLGISDSQVPSARSTMWNDGKEKALRGLGHPKSQTTLVSAAFQFQRTPPGSRAGPESAPSSGARKPSSSHSGPSPPSSRSSDRDRSSPEGPLGKWRNRNGRMRDEGKKAGEPINGLSRKYSDDIYSIPIENGPSHHLAADPHSTSTRSGRPRSTSRSASTPGYFDGASVLPLQTSLSNPSQRRSPSTPFSSPFSPTYQQDLSPVLTSPHAFPPVPAARKRSVNKSEISQPTFMSSTSSVSTVDLPPGASLSNGMDEADNGKAPPVPPINPRRNLTKAARGVRNVFARREEEEGGASLEGEREQAQDKGEAEAEAHRRMRVGARGG
ncbi:MAG: hypothetical protein FRX48_03562 [Lasallia pustulata]|uniref:Uncharacterized protein n=1 Tax=Lasallia pustulata TaxID=136370 RepID=A0A5M8PV82_9LECA|nr:MAG: hypothetical protein FRX48_03562 [Lasallia pustulata]